ncbi:hypothetical protein [Qipengyuania sp.]|uniref:hypothetical protein n=1 Tax=Qipengyuania sp. TaxID=2004515 RepID=UPI0035C7E8C0
MGAGDIVIGALALAGLALGIFVLRRADPRRCFNCAAPIEPGKDLCDTCFDRWSRG